MSDVAGKLIPIELVWRCYRWFCWRLEATPGTSGVWDGVSAKSKIDDYLNLSWL